MIFSQKTARVWFNHTYPLNHWHVLSGKILVSPLEQFIKHHFVSADMWRLLTSWACQLVLFWWICAPSHAMQPDWSRKKVYFDFKKEYQFLGLITILKTPDESRWDVSSFIIIKNFIRSFCWQIRGQIQVTWLASTIQRPVSTHHSPPRTAPHRPSPSSHILSCS